MTQAEYGIVANVVEPDRAFRMGAKVWFVWLESGGESGKFVGLSKGGRRVTKHAPMHRFGNFRSAWLPEALRPHVWCASKEVSGSEAAKLNLIADRERADHPNRRATNPDEPANLPA